MKKYLKQIENLLAENKTTGTNHSPDMIQYTRLNLQRMERWMKTGEISEQNKNEMKNISTAQRWVILTEAWCGDAAHSMPFIFKLAELNPLIRFEWKLRDEHLDLMEQYLTNGARSIPKLIVYNEQGNELFNWGPRPQHIQEKFLEMKKNNLPYADRNLELQKLYNADKGASVQNEIVSLLKKNTEPKKM